MRCVLGSLSLVDISRATVTVLSLVCRVPLLLGSPSVTLVTFHYSKPVRPGDT